MKTFLVQLINHNHEGRVLLEVEAKNQFHAVRKAEKIAEADRFGWEALEPVLN
mgnify:CR=1 FL=1|jgi:hypothetical protein